MSREEESHTHPEVIAKIREKLAEYFKAVAEATERIDSTGFTSSEVGGLLKMLCFHVFIVIFTYYS